MTIKSALIAAAMMNRYACTAIAQDQLSVPVQVLMPPAPSETMTLNLQRPPVTAPPQVTPAARLPQYQLHRRESGTNGDTESGRVRFLLLAPHRPILIEASIQIDGRPFAKVREDRIEKIMLYMKDPEAFQAAEAKAAEEAMTNKEKLFSAASAASDVLKSLRGFAADAGQEIIAAFENAEPASLESETDAADTSTDNSVAAEPEVADIAKYSAPASIYERIERYSQATGKLVSPEEVRWILANWTDGPVLLFLNDNFQRFRATQQPMFGILDINRDRVISAEEISNAVTTLTSCDLNRDEVIDAAEISQVASDPRNLQRPPVDSHPLIVRMDQPEYVRQIPARLKASYGNDLPRDLLDEFDANHDGTLDSSECLQFQADPPDLLLSVRFDTKNNVSSRLSLTSISGALRSSLRAVEPAGGAIILSFPEFQLEICSVQGPESDQISIGAIDDGYAMLPDLDTNGDERFTIRELRTFDERLRAFDRNSDGSIEFDEVPPTCRLCLGLGPYAHQTLSVLRQRRTPEAAAAVAIDGAPDWFIEMDKNKDFDLTRTEFPGTDEQFQQLDRDGDGLISSAESQEAARDP